ncbi:TetR/AcrR family transcriptional regulator [Porticoccus sp.]|uniref:TetR/AcrR family transcriptional regulator n=1 Tax=Porticoccus sp. TaxID=2024853 RepID=UPI003F6A5040
MQTPDKPTTRYAHRHERAVAAAAAVFADKGFHGASTRDIAEKLGIQQGSLYYYFKSKEAALEEVCLTALRDYVSHIESIARQPGEIENKLKTAIAAHLASYEHNNEAMKVHNEQRLYLPKERRKQLNRLGSHYRQQLEGIFCEGVSNGQLRKDLDCHFTALSLIGLCNYWGVQLLRNTTLRTEEVTKNCAEILLLGCLAGKTATPDTETRTDIQVN